MPTNFKQSQITINGRFLEQPVTGVQRYAREALSALDDLLANQAIKQTHEVICLISKMARNLPEWKAIKTRTVGNFSGNIWEQFELPHHAQESRLFSPANIAPWLGKDQVLTIHDMSVYTMPEAYSPTFRLKYKTIYQRLSKTARKIITVSNFSKSEICKYLRTEPRKIIVIPHGHEHLLKTKADENILAEKHVGEKPYFLCVGSSSPHKNLRVVAESLKYINRDDFEIISVGGKFSNVFQQTEAQLNQHIRHLGYVSDAQLCALYKNARAFIFPSKYEGFGLPVLEALAFGCPVICSDATSIPEVGGSLSEYFKWDDARGLAQKMRKFLEKPKTTMNITAHLAKFSWENCARKTWDVLINK